MKLCGLQYQSQDSFSKIQPFVFNFFYFFFKSNSRNILSSLVMFHSTDQHNTPQKSDVSVKVDACVKVIHSFILFSCKL